MQSFIDRVVCLVDDGRRGVVVSQEKRKDNMPYYLIQFENGEQEWHPDIRVVVL